MEPGVTPIDATLGAVVTGFALSQMDASTWKNVEQAFHDYAVLVFPGQHLTEDEQVAFANRFGDIELLAPDPEEKAVAISNQKPDGTVMNADEHRFKSLRGNEGWHTDSSYMPLAAKASVLSHRWFLRPTAKPSGLTCGPLTMRSMRRRAGASRGFRHTTLSITPRPGSVM
jgi:alpha-ketoglutarate-dependent taurine dioxygenase